MLEMVVVLVIAGILTVIAVSIFGTSSGKIALEEHQEDLRELLIAGRRTARRTGVPQTIEWEAGTRQWHWKEREETLGMPSVVEIMKEEDPETSELTEVIPVVIFYGNGRSQKSQFTLQSENMRVHFQISAATGAIRSILENADAASGEKPQTLPLWKDAEQ